MPGEGAEAAVHLGARVFLEFDLPRIVEAMRYSAMLLASPPTAISVQRKCVEVIIRTTKKGHDKNKMSFAGTFPSRARRPTARAYSLT